MKAINFKPVTSIELAFGEYEIDLHNVYLFTDFSYSVKSRILILKWIRGEGKYVNQNWPHYIVLRIKDVDFFEVSPRDIDMPFSEDDCLEGIAYLTDEEWCNGPFWRDAEPDDNWKWVFQFMSGMSIIVGAKSILIETTT